MIEDDYVDKLTLQQMLEQGSGYKDGRFFCVEGLEERTTWLRSLHPAEVHSEESQQEQIHSPWCCVIALNWCIFSKTYLAAQ